MQSPSIHTEKVLLLRVADGDENAFTLLFRLYSGVLGSYIFRLTESEPMSQEVVQDVFLKIWTGRDALAGVECFKAYLFVVARNHAFNCLKQVARERNRRREWVNAILHSASHMEEDIPATDRSKLIDEAVELLPNQQKKVYMLSRRNGIRQREIARELNISHQTVKKHLVLAIRFLKNHLRTHLGILTLILVQFGL